MPTGKLYQLTLTGTLAGQFVQNILHYQFEETSSQSAFINAAAIGNAWTADEIDNWLSIISSSYIMSSVRCQQISDGGGATYTQTSGVAGMTGARAAEISVQTVGPLINFPATVDKPVVGKIFVPGIPEADVSMGVIGSTLLGDLTTFLGNWIPAITISGTVAGQLYYCVANAAKDNWARPDGGYVSATIGTQRRRARPHG